MTVLASSLSALEAPHVHRAFFAWVDFTSGERRFHTGVGPATIGGETWEGVNNPFGGQIVSLSGIQEPRFGQAPKITTLFSGANPDWMRSLRNQTIEGVACRVYWAAFDAETGDVLIDLTELWAGRLTRPSFRWSGPGVRTVSIGVVSQDEGLQFPQRSTDWSPAGQKVRYPGDKGLDLIGAEIVHVYK